MKHADDEPQKEHRQQPIEEVIRSLNHRSDTLGPEIFEQLQLARIKALSHHRIKGE